jgi:beta-alanine degradation protein BauB
MTNRPAGILAIVAGMIILLSGGQSLGQHAGGAHPSPEVAATSGPSGMKVELDNDAVLVLRIRMAPREKTPAHDLSGRLVVWLTDAKLRDTFPDGRSEDIERTPGTIDWVPAQRHAGENLSDQPIEFLAIVPKAASSSHSR